MKLRMFHAFPRLHGSFTGRAPLVPPPAHCPGLLLEPRHLAPSQKPIKVSPAPGSLWQGKGLGKQVNQTRPIFTNPKISLAPVQSEILIVASVEQFLGLISPLIYLLLATAYQCRCTDIDAGGDCPCDIVLDPPPALGQIHPQHAILDHTVTC